MENSESRRRPRRRAAYVAMINPAKDYRDGWSNQARCGLEGKWDFKVTPAKKPGKFPKSAGNDKRGKGAK